MTENPSPETLVDDAQLTPANGGGTVDSPALTLAELNSFLGSDFKDKDTALKALKDTKDFVGKRKEDILKDAQPIIKPVDDTLISEVQSLKKDLFYTQNPQYKGYEALINKMGGNPAEVVASSEFKTVFEKVSEAEKVTQGKSVVGSNSRLAQTKSITDNAIQVANARGSTNEDVALVLAQGIMGKEE